MLFVWNKKGIYGNYLEKASSLCHFLKEDISVNSTFDIHGPHRLTLYSIVTFPPVQFYDFFCLFYISKIPPKHDAWIEHVPSHKTTTSTTMAHKLLYHHKMSRLKNNPKIRPEHGPVSTLL